tara:strand:+ start:2138 stop:2275 length:138 start_codon:yes stop_codon:yes gene_type:complete
MNKEKIIKEIEKLEKTLHIFELEKVQHKYTEGIRDKIKVLSAKLK